MFLHLFDGHPELLTYPVDINILYAYFPHHVEKQGADDRLLRDRLRRVAVDDLHQFGLTERGFSIGDFGERLTSRLADKDLRSLGDVLS